MRRGTGMGMKGGKRVNRQTKASLSAGGVMGWGCSLRGGPRWLALTPDTLVGSRRGDGRTDGRVRAGEPRVHRVAEWGNRVAIFDNLPDQRFTSKTIGKNYFTGNTQ